MEYFDLLDHVGLATEMTTDLSKLVMVLNRNRYLLVTHVESVSVIKDK